MGTQECFGIQQTPCNLLPQRNLLQRARVTHLYGHTWENSHWTPAGQGDHTMGTEQDPVQENGYFSFAVPLPSFPMGISRTATSRQSRPLTCSLTTEVAEPLQRAPWREASPGAPGGDGGQPGAPSAGLRAASRCHGRTAVSCRAARSASPEPDRQPGMTVCKGVTPSFRPRGRKGTSSFHSVTASQSSKQNLKSLTHSSEKPNTGRSPPAVWYWAGQMPRVPEQKGSLWEMQQQLENEWLHFSF